MWIEQLPNGKYRYCERFKNPHTGKVKKISLVSSKKNDKANMSVKLYEAYTATLGAPSASSEVSFGELVDEWFSVYVQTVRKSTAINRRNVVDHIKSDLGHFLASKVDDIMMNQHLLRLSKSGRPYSYTNKRREVLKHIIKFGVKYGYYDNDFSEKLVVERINMPKENTYKYLEHDEIKSLVQQLEEMGKTEVANLSMFQMLTGVRIGEAVAIDYEQDIDLTSRTITINKSWSHMVNDFGPTKTGKDRVIHINDDTITLIKKQILISKTKKLRYKSISPDNTLLFTTRTGKPYSLLQFNRELSKVNIPGKRVTTHYFRHTFVTLAIEHGIPLHLIAHHVGHTDTKMIEKIYAHHSQKLDESLRQSIERMTVNFI